MTASYLLDAANDAEIGAIPAAAHDNVLVMKNTPHAEQEWECIERCERAMACDGDVVATINRLLDTAIASMGDNPANAETVAGLMAVREYHLPCLLDAFEVETSHAD